ncbi:hypothetical protein BDZ90DRAFT_231177 [Jaminaea rosea]|uniref:Phosphomethylpyrimidine kinase n=1 Tax=Jaminaea rosea TaxID=1569628 RepID=A0A316UY08_9BASI|nr:hypothetical protein BDZ90DRAFT_231177 [Jaminaea rosea]PWN29191.1 hypothetical protein BDZ90DRAFT_231177 [Jaminaea rosea]
MSGHPANPSLSLWSASSTHTPRVCTIAGSDSGGGAGIQADLKTVLALGGYGLSVITALTAQNTTGVSGIHVPPVDFLRKQVQSVRKDIRIDGWKIGMLANEEVVGVVAEELKDVKAPVVLDPVMVSTSGSLLLPHEAIQGLITKLLPQCTLLTPNLPEAEQLLAHATVGRSEAQGSSKQPIPSPQPLQTLQDRLDAAKKLSDLGPKAVLLKGGHKAFKRREVDEALRSLGILQADQQPHEHHGRCRKVQQDLEGSRSAAPDALSPGAAVSLSSRGSSHNLIVVRSDGHPYSPVLRHLLNEEDDGAEEEVVIDILFTSQTNTYTLFVGPRLTQGCTHGTGCTLSSALATHLAAGSGSGEGEVDEDAQLRRACWRSIAYVQAAIVRGYEDLGKGPGALDHAVSVGPRGVLQSTAERFTAAKEQDDISADTTERYAGMLSPSSSSRLGSQPTPVVTALLSRSQPLWEAYVWHPFVQRLALHFQPASSSSSASHQPLSRAPFLHFLKQDYHFLLHYSRLWSRSASSASSFAEADYFLTLAHGMAREAAGHVALCEGSFGVGKRELEAEREGEAVMAYTRFVLDVADKHGGASLETLTVTMPCLLGYADMGWRLRLADSGDSSSKMSDSLRTWYQQYVSTGYLTAVRAGLAKLEEEAAGMQQPSAERMERLQGLWDQALRLERGMWDEAMRVTGEEM